MRPGIKDIANIQPKYPLIPFKLITSFLFLLDMEHSLFMYFQCVVMLLSVIFSSGLCFFTSFALSSAESTCCPLKILGAPARLGLSPRALPVHRGLFLVLAGHSIGIQASMGMFCRCLLVLYKAAV